MSSSSTPSTAPVLPALDEISYPGRTCFRSGLKSQIAGAALRLGEGVITTDNWWGWLGDESQNPPHWPTSKTVGDFDWTLLNPTFSNINITTINGQTIAQLITSNTPSGSNTGSSNTGSNTGSSNTSYSSTGAGTVPIGTIIHRIGRNTTVPDGYLLLNGGIVSRTTYPLLYQLAVAENFLTTEAAWSGNPQMFSTGDGSSTFRIPDLRGYFIRNLDLGRGVDPSRDPAVGQADSVRSHQHQTVTDQGIYFLGGGIQQFNPGLGQVSRGTDWYTGFSGGSETRPINAAIPALIRAY